MPISIRPLLDADLEAADTVLRLAFHNPASRLDDLQLYRRMQPDGWLVAVLDGRLVGTVGATNYGAFAHVGFMAVHPDAQRQGVGQALMQSLLVGLDALQVPLVTLDSSKAGRPLYDRLGFIAYDETLVLVRHGLPTGSAPPATVQPITARELDEVTRFDADVFGADRRKVLQVLLEAFPGRAFLQRDSSGELAGYLFAQQNRIGPWVMFRPVPVDELLQAALALPYAESPSLTVPSGNRLALELLQRHGFEPVRVNQHMARGAAGLPGQRLKVYSQTSLAVG